MQNFFYRFLTTLSRLMGKWVFRIAAWGIASGYFLFSPTRVAVSVRFYRALSPVRHWLYHLWCAWKQYHSFTHVFMDRIFFRDAHDFVFTNEGWEYLDEAVNKKTGGVILMSHVGNWEIAADLLLRVHGRKNSGLKLLLYLGLKRKEQIERAQKESLARNGVKIIAVEKDGGSPFDILEGINFVKEGGFVSLTGDRKWRADQRTISVRFLGHEAFLPETPFIFALLSGAPLFIFFTFRTDGGAYHFKNFPPEYVCAENRSERRNVIRKAAQAYAELLEDAVKRHPFEWYHFEPFLGRKLDNE